METQQMPDIVPIQQLRKDMQKSALANIPWHVREKESETNQIQKEPSNR